MNLFLFGQWKVFHQEEYTGDSVEMGKPRQYVLGHYSKEGWDRRKVGTLDLPTFIMYYLPIHAMLGPQG